MVHGLWPLWCLGKPIMNIWHFSNAYAIAAASPSIGGYLHSASVQYLLPTNIRCQPSGQQIWAFSIVYWQCFCRSRKPSPSLLQSRAKQVTQSLSNVVCLIYVNVCCWCLRSQELWVRLQPQSTLGKVIRKDPDTIGYITHFWWEFEIRVKKVVYFLLLKDIN